ncbi:MAG TPA: hypothetical protein VGO07_01475 [Candidatus Saccharimonadales bacterium]|jgi:hypothetical protein|nr:hypothetical protein [Candidatus Saccharimonadales bacterium]
MNAWYRAAEIADRSLAQELLEGTDPYAAAREIGLPTPPEVRYESVGAFLEQGAAGIAELERQGVSNFYVGLRPHDPQLVKHRQFGLAAEDISTYVTGEIPDADYGRYVVQLAEYAPARYGATIIINDEGTVTLEMVDGEMARLATGKQTPQYTVHSDPFTGIMRYSFDDVALRTSVWRAISRIPSAEADTGPQRRLPGYYEVSFIDRGGRLTPIFFDYKKTAIYSKPRRFDEDTLKTVANTALSRDTL